MSDRFFRLVMQFGYETDGGRASRFWESPSIFSDAAGQGGKERDQAFQRWRRSKTPVASAQFAGKTLLKSGDHNHAFIVELASDGTAVERSLYDRGDSWQGSWEILGDYVLAVRVGEYELHLLRHSNGLLSGVEYGPHGPAYFIAAIPSARTLGSTRASVLRVAPGGQMFRDELLTSGELHEHPLTPPSDQMRSGRWNWSSMYQLKGPDSVLTLNVADAESVLHPAPGYDWLLIGTTGAGRSREAVAAVQIA